MRTLPRRTSWFFLACSIGGVGAIACSSGSTPVNVLGSDASTASDGSLAPDGSIRTPGAHRAVASACPKARGASGTTTGSAGDSCTTDQECTKGTNGRCLMLGNVGIRSCSYDQCSQDSGCGAGSVCNCRESATSASPNVCTKGTCAIDSDCGSGHYCVGSVEPCSRVPTYYCTTNADECADDNDCPALGTPPGQTPQGCRYVKEAGHFKCTARVACAG